MGSGVGPSFAKSGRVGIGGVVGLDATGKAALRACGAGVVHRPHAKRGVL